jgi:8-amino-7-oxononanoate synthase
VASLASSLLGLQVNERRGDELRTLLHHRTRTVLDHLDKLGVATSNISGFPLIELALADPEPLHAVGRHIFDRGIYMTLAPYPVVPRDEVGFRVQLTAANTADQLDRLLTVLQEINGRFGFRRPPPLTGRQMVRRCMRRQSRSLLSTSTITSRISNTSSICCGLK